MKFSILIYFRFFEVKLHVCNVLKVGNWFRHKWMENCVWIFDAFPSNIEEPLIVHFSVRKKLISIFVCSFCFHCRLFELNCTFFWLTKCGSNLVSCFHQMNWKKKVLWLTSELFKVWYSILEFLFERLEWKDKFCFHSNKPCNKIRYLYPIKMLKVEIIHKRRKQIRLHMLYNTYTKSKEVE